MENFKKLVRILFAVPWIIFGIQHYMYADFVATLVPGFMPIKLFWTYFTGTAMIAAGMSFIINRFSRLAAILLSVMLWGFILMIHIPALLTKPFSVDALTRPLQDTALACAALLLADSLSKQTIKSVFFDRLVTFSRYLFALMIIGFGVQQFFNLDFVTARIPQYFPFRLFWVYLAGIVLILGGLIIAINRKSRLAAIALGLFMLVIVLLNHGYLLANDVHQPILWTGAMIDLAVASGVLILADNLSAKS